MRFEDHQYYVYILASRSRTLYIGVTNNLLHRIAQHRINKAPSFTSRYKTHRLVYFEPFQYINNAIAREKYLKHFTREEKIALISNPPTQPGKTSPPNHSTFQRLPRRDSISSAYRHPARHMAVHLEAVGPTSGLKPAPTPDFERFDDASTPPPAKAPSKSGSPSNANTETSNSPYRPPTTSSNK
jgi:putative endonuclease